jgi:ABC-type transport system substrate-binding protein
MSPRAPLAILLALALAAPAAAGAQTKDDTVVYAIPSDMQNWDPPNSVLRESIILGYNVFDHLAARDLKTGKVGPSLATSWRNLDDTTWEVKLRQGVKFHDGTRFTARDVKATFDRVLNPENKLTARGNHAKIKSVETVDDHTVRFKTDGPYPLFVERMTALVIQSDKVIKEKGHEWMQENPVGTGPYKLVKWNKKQDGKSDPMFEWSWGYYSIFDADAIFYDVMTCNQPYSYYCNKAFDDLVAQGRSTLDTKQRAEIYAKAQKMIHDDAAYLFKWGLRGVWGVSNRIDYEAPRDEVDRMWAVTPRKK